MTEPTDARATGKFILDAANAALKSGADVDSCAALVARADRHFEAAFEHLTKKGAPVACRVGCSFCCHLRVSVTALEAIALFRYLKTQLPSVLATEIERRLMANADEIARMTPAQQMSTNLKCAFLEKGSCSVYPMRPMACALHHSLDVSACERVYDSPTDVSIGIRKLKVIEDMMAATHAATDQAHEQFGLSSESMELHTAVTALLRDPSLIARWRSGRPLLKPAK